MRDLQTRHVEPATETKPVLNTVFGRKIVAKAEGYKAPRRRTRTVIIKR